MCHLAKRFTKEEISFEARDSEYIDNKSGVSAHEYYRL
jgi:hypothetical protein